MKEKRVRMTEHEIEVATKAIDHMLSEHHSSFHAVTRQIARNLSDRLKTGNRGRGRASNFRFIAHDKKIWE